MNMPNKDERKRFLSSPNIDVKEQKRSKTVIDIENMDADEKEEVEEQINKLIESGQYDMKDNKSLLICLATAFTTVMKSELNKMQRIVDKKDADIEALQRRVDYLEEKLDDQEQYSRRSCIRLNGLDDTEGENTDDIVMDLAKTMKIDIKRTDIDRSHRIGKKDEAQSKHRSIIVKFTNYKARLKFLTNKKKLSEVAKATNDKNLSRIYISEDLTKMRMHVAFFARNLKRQNKTKDTWTRDGAIFVKTNKNNVVRFTSYEKINNYKFD